MRPFWINHIVLNGNFQITEQNYAKNGNNRGDLTPKRVFKNDIVCWCEVLLGAVIELWRPTLTKCQVVTIVKDLLAGSAYQMMALPDFWYILIWLISPPPDRFSLSNNISTTYFGMLAFSPSTRMAFPPVGIVSRLSVRSPLGCLFFHLVLPGIFWRWPTHHQIQILQLVIAEL